MSEKQGFYPAQASSVRKGGYLIIRDRPCKVIDMSTSKPGKHGHAKLNFTATDIFTGKKLEDICQSTHNVNIPEVIRKEYLLVDIAEDKYMSLMDQDSGEINEDIQLRNKKLDNSIESNFNDGKELLVTIISSMGEDAVSDSKENK